MTQDRPTNKFDKNCFLEIPRHMLMYNLPRARSMAESFLSLPRKLAKYLGQEMCQMNETEPGNVTEPGL